MLAQLNEIIAWKCLKCGRVLTTEKGKKRHLETCKYIPPVSDNQITCDDVGSYNHSTKEKKHA